jgi:hypothetical protein
MVSATILVVGLLALTSASTTTSLLRKRGVQEDMVFEGLMDRLEWVRGELYTDGAFHQQAVGALASAGQFAASFPLDNDGDGIQDLSFAAGDKTTPIIQVAIAVPDPPGDADVMLQVVVTATWYGIGGNRSRSLSTFVANRVGYGG